MTTKTKKSARQVKNREEAMNILRTFLQEILQSKSRVTRKGNVRDWTYACRHREQRLVVRTWDNNGIAPTHWVEDGHNIHLGGLELTDALDREFGKALVAWVQERVSQQESESEARADTREKHQENRQEKDSERKLQRLATSIANTNPPIAVRVPGRRSLPR